VFDPGRLLQPSLMLAVKAGAYPGDASVSGLTCKHLTRLGRPARNKHSSLLGPRAAKLSMAVIYYVICGKLERLSVSVTSTLARHL
jgi:hypothetical protein